MKLINDLPTYYAAAALLFFILLLLLLLIKKKTSSIYIQSFSFLGTPDREVRTMGEEAIRKFHKVIGI